MTKNTHTHRGTCQICGHTQAVDNISGLIAKHGYTVDYGYFNGTCDGSNRKPAEHDVTFTWNTINYCIATAINHDARVLALKTGREVPKTFERWNPNKIHSRTNTKGDYDTLPIIQATPAESTARIASAIHLNELRASGLRSHEQMLRMHVLLRNGQPLYAVADIVPPAKAAIPVVDIKTATVTGAYKTKQARKDALDKLSRAYDKCRRLIQDAYLDLPHDQRTEAKSEVYYGPYQLSHWRPKHSMQALNEFPHLAPVINEIDALARARDAVKAAP